MRKRELAESQAALRSWRRRERGRHSSAVVGQVLALGLHGVLALVLSGVTLALLQGAPRRAPIEVGLAPPSAVEVAALPEIRPEEPDEAPELDELFQEAASSDDEQPDDETLRGAATGFPALPSVMGVGAASGGAGRGGSRDQAGGPSKASDAAILAGLEWLARHQNPDGGWSFLDEGSHFSREGRPWPPKRDYDAPPPEPTMPAQEGLLPHRSQVASTGLALLCFILAERGPDRAGRYAERLRRAVAWLLTHIDRDGSFEYRNRQGRIRDWGLPRNEKGAYRQAIGVLALAEAQKRAPNPTVGEALARTVRSLVEGRNAQGWRYYPDEDRADTSVNTWVVLALQAAEKAGVAVDPGVYTGVRDYLRVVSWPSGRTRYLAPAPDVEGGPTPAMDASGLFLRLALGGDPTSPTNHAAAGLVARAGLKLHIARPPSTRGGCRNLYELYYAALALFQVGGSRWRRFNQRSRDALVRAQVRRVQPGDPGLCVIGSWVPSEVSWLQDDRLLSTTFALLTLEVYYRYARSPLARLADEDPEATPFQAALRRALLSVARARNEAGVETAERADAALGAALQALADAASGATRADQGLRPELLAARVEMAALLQDRLRVLARVEEYLAALPPGAPPSAAVLDVRREAWLASLSERVAAALAEGAPPAARAEVRAELAAADRTIRGEAEDARTGAGVHPRHEATLDRLKALVDRDWAIADGLLDFPAGTVADTRHPSLSQLRRLLLERARDRLGQACRLGRADRPAGEAAFRGAEEDIHALEARAPDASEQAALLRVRVHLLRALSAIGRPDVSARLALELDEELGLLPDADPALRARVAEAERTALVRLVQEGRASEAQRARLRAGVQVWLDRARDAGGDPREDLVVAEALAACESWPAAVRLYRRALDGQLPAELKLRAVLGLSAAHCATGQGRRATRCLTGNLAPEARQRWDVRMAWAAAYRARNEPARALREYSAILRGLQDERPPAWWETAEQALRTYLEQGDRERAGRLFAELLRLHREDGEPETGRLARLQALLGAR